MIRDALPKFRVAPVGPRELEGRFPVRRFVGVAE